MDEVEEFIARACGTEEKPRKRRRRRQRVRLLHTADGHARVHRLHDDGHAQGMQRLLDAVTDLDGQALLHLQPAGKGFDDARDLAQPGDFPVRDVGDVALSDEREHVVLAHRIKLDVLDQDHLPVFFIEHRRLDDFRAVLRVPLRQELERLGHALRCLQEPFPVGIFAQQAQDLADVNGNLPCRFDIKLFLFRVCHLCSGIVVENNFSAYAKIDKKIPCRDVFLYIFAAKWGALARIFN